MSQSKHSPECVSTRLQGLLHALLSQTLQFFSLKQSVGEHLKVLSGTDEGLGTLRLGERDKRFLS